MVLNATDTLVLRIERLGPTHAEITYTRYQSPTYNQTLCISLEIAKGSKGETVLNVVTSRNGDDPLNITWNLRREEYATATPTFCGDSAWWFATDTFDLDPRATDNSRAAPSRFTPLLIGRHGLKTTNEKWFPADFLLGGVARVWDMVRNHGQGDEVVCKVRGFIETGMTLLYPPHRWGN
ncbi:hypothetical protein MFIFM68171_07150 [Madurella fahalii]|uniref:Uncharacterized protein n=1 Tax=Madurella fahalii TaxID=1157608 RepID=A0ABQ0GGP7_9PEZI